MPNLEGQTLKGRYRIEELLGRGGMAEVYKAWDMRRQYHVAVKVMREDLAEDLEFLARFKREAQALAALSHANIVRFYSFERQGPLAFLVMDFVEGTTLRTRILEAEGTPLPLDEVAAITQQICAALHYAHEENVLHRDVKPGNIMIRQGVVTGASGQVLVTDFGIAKAADAATATTVMPGTPAYMSPEQCRSEPLDERADVYALGILVYEMLAGRRPFVGNTDATTGGTRERLRWEQIHADPPSLRALNPEVPGSLQSVVLKALAKDREDRWPSAMAFWQAFATALQAADLPLPGDVAPIATPAPQAVPAPRSSVAQPSPGGTPSPVPRPATPAGAAPAAAPGTGFLRRVPAWIWPLVVGLVIVAAVVAARGGRSAGLPTAEPTAIAAQHVTAVVTAEQQPTADEPTEAPPTAEPTATVDEVATEVAKAAAVAATLTAQAPTPTPTLTPSPSPTATPTATDTPRPTATARPTKQPTAKPKPTKKPTARPTSTPRRSSRTYPAPLLLAPGDWEGFKGRDTPVILRWSSGVNLAADEYFLVKTATGPNFEFHAQWLVKVEQLQLPPQHGAVEYWTTFGQQTRWTVTIVQSNGKTVYGQLSPESTSRHFVWTEVN